MLAASGAGTWRPEVIISSAVCAPDQARQTLGAAAAGQDADQHLGQAHLGGGDGDAVVAGHRIFQAAAEGEAVDRGDHGLRTGVQHVVGAFPDRRALAAGAETADVGTGDEAAAVAHQHHGLDRRDRRCAVFRECDDALGHPRAERVDRRIVDDDDADFAVFLEADDGGF